LSLFQGDDSSQLGNLPQETAANFPSNDSTASEAVFRAYNAVLDRDPNLPEFDIALANLKRDRGSWKSLLNSLAGGVEFFALRLKKNSTQLVDQMCRGLLNRAATDEEKQAFSPAISANGAGGVALQIAATQEFFTGVHRDSPVSKAAPEVWLAPGPASPDLLNLLDKTGTWSTVFNRVDVIQLFAGNVTDDCSACGPNLYSASVQKDFFRKILSAGKKLSVEVSVLKSGLCDGVSLIQTATEILKKVKAAGGVVSYLSLDNPSGASLHDCGLTMGQTTTAIASFIRQVQAAYGQIFSSQPRLKFFLMDDYASLGPDRLTAIMEGLRAAGVQIDGFHPLISAEEEKTTSASELSRGLQNLMEYSRFRGLNYGGVFFGDTENPSNFNNSAAVWALRVHLLTQSFPDYVVLESRDQRTVNGMGFSYPFNMPESNPNTLTGAALEVLKRLGTD
jgi:hypothetical protein